MAWNNVVRITHGCAILFSADYLRKGCGLLACRLADYLRNRARIKRKNQRKARARARIGVLARVATPVPIEGGMQWQDQ